MTARRCQLGPARKPNRGADALQPDLAVDPPERLRCLTTTVESPGAGPMRRMLTPEEILLDDWQDAGAPDQPGEPADFPLSRGEPLSRVEPNGVMV